MSRDRRISVARSRAALDYVATVAIAAAIIGVNLLATHAQVAHGWVWRDRQRRSAVTGIARRIS
jgi:hypothetical protein